MEMLVVLKRSFFASVLPAALALVASSARAQPVLTNGDFSANASSFLNNYGYSGAPNAASITGWTTGPGGFGINNPAIPPALGAAFTDNGTAQTPDVAFFQEANTFSQTITGLVANDSYAITFDYNARNSGGNPIGRPTINVAIGGTSQTLANVQPVGGSNPYYAITVPFTATASSQTLQFTMSGSTSNQAGADFSTLLNNVAVKPVSIVTVQNPSFEADGTPSVWPGYASGNAGLITGWQSTGAVGINPAAPTSSPIAPFGPSISQTGLNIPDGSHFAFMQDDGNSGTSVSNPALTR
jgi:hypothetical protein